MSQSCSDDIGNIQLSVPYVPCNDLANLAQWQTFTNDMNQLAQNPDFRRVAQQCICLNGSTCVAQEKCTNNLFNNPGGSMDDPVCRTCIFNSLQCRPFEQDFIKLGRIMASNLSHPITPQTVQSLVSNCCPQSGPPLSLPLLTQIANVLNDTNQDTTSSADSPWVQMKTWVIIGAVAFVLVSVGLVMYSRRSHVSETHSRELTRVVG
jgi:hypothetical protein